MNKSTFQGRITYKETFGEENKKRTKFSVAVRNKMKNNDGSQKEDNFIPLVAFGKTSEFIDKYFDIGDPIIISDAEFTSSQTKTDDGKTMVYYNFVVREVEFPMAKPKAKQEQTNQNNQQSAEAPKTEGNDQSKGNGKLAQARQDSQTETSGEASQGNDDFDDDIPF